MITVRKQILHYCCLILIMFMSITITYGYLWHHYFYGPLTRPRAKNIDIIVPKNISFNHIVHILHDNNIISNPIAFNAITRFKKLSTSIKAGEYKFSSHDNPETVLNKLIRGETVQYYITIPEGLTSRTIVERLRQTPVMSGSIIEIPADGTLLPETYAYSRGHERQQLIQRMQTAMKSTIQQLWSLRYDNLPFKTQHQALTLASIVEKETALAHERSLVAAVFINRLHRGMPLQADPTVIYAIEMIQGQTLTRSLSRDDLKLQHPYNTYVINGLPPGPICNPGRAALRAVLQPAKTNNLYFVADGTGGHVFSDTLEEHQHHHQVWRRLRNTMKE